MSAMSEKARERAKAKVTRMVAPNKGAIDASGWKEPLGEEGGTQTGPRPVSRRQFAHGGKVHGERPKMHAGRKPRAAGGMTANEFQNRDMKSANESRSGPKHVGGMRRGGRSHKMGGGLALPNWADSVQRAAGGRMGKMVGGPMMGRTDMPPPRMGNGMPAGGVAGATPMMRPRPELMGRGMMRKDGGKVDHGKDCGCAKCSGGAVGKRTGGSVTDGTLEGTRPEGGRLARKGGGRAKKGMNVNIIIAPASPNRPMMPPAGMAPPPPAGGPVGLHQGAPPPPPMMPPGGAPPAMGPPPMGRAAGGRAYPIKHGAGGGLGRREKARAYGL